MEFTLKLTSLRLSFLTIIPQPKNSFIYINKAKSLECSPIENKERTLHPNLEFLVLTNNT